MSRGSSAVDERTRERLAAEREHASRLVSDGSGPLEAAVSEAPRVTVIRPPSRLPRLEVGELWHYRDLLATLIWRDIVVRYKQTFLGVTWALLVPAFTALVYILVFGKFADFPDGGLPYPMVVIGGVLPMQYVASSLTNSSMSLASNIQLVTKVYFPRTLLPLAAVIVPMLDLLIGVPVLVLMMWIYETWPGGWEVFLAPLFLLLALVTALGAGFFLSAVNVKYRDVRYIIPVLLPVLPLLSGVIYAVHDLPTKWQWLLAVNPITTVVSGLRWSVLDAVAPDPGQAALSVSVAVVVFLVGLAVFRSSEPRFADTI